MNPLPFSLGPYLQGTLKNIAKSLPLFDETFDPDLRPAEERFGDFQANGVLAYCKKTRQNPRSVAQTLCDAFAAQNEDFDVSVAGAGFLNFRLTDHAMIGWLRCFHASEQYEGHFRSGFSDKTVVVDYSSPNTAKRMHVGHLRSMVIGEALQRFLRFGGAKVIRDNHIGDWGTQFGILLAEIKRTGYNFNEPPEVAVETLEALYQTGSQRTKTDPQALETARKELVKLQRGDTENFALWEKINKISYASFEAIYQRMGVTFDYVLGESFYRDKVEAVYDALQACALAKIDQGALVVFHPEHSRSCKQPFIIRKSDGASNYASTDLATVAYRSEQLHADAMVYVTDARQCDHFEQLFLTVKKWFEAEKKPVPMLFHAPFGMVLGQDGKAIKTREGKPIQLHQLLNEAVARAHALICQKSPDLSPEEKRHVAEVVGLGAVKYADLSQDRMSNYRFEFDKMIRFEGNTAPYLLYAVARIHAIFRKADIDATKIKDDSDLNEFSTETERALAHKLLAFPSILALALQELKPHHLCRYLYELAGVFSTFYNADKVLSEKTDIQNLRLLLCRATLATLEKGLHLLGLETLEKM
ncbi:MAG: arginine--tRNA ligase [Opitutales bacterium]|nr:arginine--tRNA ligase [Opitutales bacterium]